MFEEQGNTPVTWNDYKNTKGICNRLLLESAVEGFSLRLLHHEVVAEWLLCRQETAVPATAIDEATCFAAKSQGLVSVDALVMLYPIGMVDSILLGYSFSETHGLNSSSSAVPTCRRFVFDTANWEYLELFWFSNATVTASWMKFFPDGKRIRYFVLYEAPPEGKLPYKLLHSFELIGYRTTVPELNIPGYIQDNPCSSAGKGDNMERFTESPLGIQDNLSDVLLYDRTWEKNKEATRKCFQLLQQLYMGEYRGNERFTQYQVSSGHILEEHIHSFRTIVEPLDRSVVELEKVMEMQRLCFLPRARGLELSHKLHELMVEAGILLEYFGPDHIVNEEAKQKRMERRLAKRKRGKPNEIRKQFDSLENVPTKMLSSKGSCNKNSWDTSLLQKESHSPFSSDWKRRMTPYSTSPSSPGLSQSSQTNLGKRMREESSIGNRHAFKRENIEQVDSQVSNSTLKRTITTTSNNNKNGWIPQQISWGDNKSLYMDSFDPSQVTEEPTEHNRVNLMLGPYVSSSSIQGDMIGFSDEKERIWMFSTTEPEWNNNTSSSRQEFKSKTGYFEQEMRDTRKVSTKSQDEEDYWLVANDELYRLGEEWPNPLLLQPTTQVDESISHSSPSRLEPLSDIPFWNSFHYSWPEDMLYTSSESSSDWFIKTLALEDSHGMINWKEMDSGVAQVEQIEKQSWCSQWIEERGEEDDTLHWT